MPKTVAPADLRGLEEENAPVGCLQAEDVRLLGVVGCRLGQRVMHTHHLLGDGLIPPIIHLTRETQNPTQYSMAAWRGGDPATLSSRPFAGKEPFPSKPLGKSSSLVYPRELPGSR